jgi:uncharacterized repeat protein (TIGR03803 family)
MKGLGFGCKLLCSCVAASLLAGCGGSQTALGAPAAMAGQLVSQRSSTNGFEMIYGFTDQHNDQQPIAAVTSRNGVLYGTTVGGGGTVYKLTTGGTETVLHKFGHEGDVDDPEGNLLLLGGTFYGTGYVGGAGQGCCGGIFSITPSGQERVIYSFKEHSDVLSPRGGLTPLNGKMYGSGSDANGGIFEITTAGKERIVHRFQGAPHDAAGDVKNLLVYKGVLYGATGGGAHNHGAIFSLTPSGSEHILYSFRGSPKDGDGPNSLTMLNGVFYGTTSSGGSNKTCEGGCGTVFSFTLTGKEAILHNFSPTDGTRSVAALVPYNGYLYGTTCAGGTYGGNICYDRASYGTGKGTVFRISTTGQFAVLHYFQGYDGAFPVAPLYVLNGALYGTAQAGGDLWGTVFRINP